MSRDAPRCPTLPLLKTNQDDTLKTRILTLDRETGDLDQVIDGKEEEMNELVAGLYGVDCSRF